MSGISDLLTKQKTFEPEIDRATGERRNVSDTETVEKQFYAMDPQARYSWLMANRGGKASAITQDVGALNAIAGEDIDAIAAGLQKSRAKNLFERNVRGALSGAGGDVATEYVLNQRKEEAELQAGAELSRTERAREIFQLAKTRYLADKGVPFQASMAQAGFETNLFLGMDPYRATKLQPLHDYVRQDELLSLGARQSDGKVVLEKLGAVLQDLTKEIVKFNTPRTIVPKSIGVQH
jgi:hypothetical protein